VPRRRSPDLSRTWKGRPTTLRKAHDRTDTEPPLLRQDHEVEDRHAARYALSDLGPGAQGLAIESCTKLEARASHVREYFTLTIPAHIRWRTRAVRYNIVLQLTVTPPLAGMTRRRLQS
jgi:hypothetical protein